MCRRLPTSFMSVGGMSQFVSQIPRMDAILMGYWMAGQMSTTMSSVIYKSDLTTGKKSLGGSS